MSKREIVTLHRTVSVSVENGRPRRCTSPAMR